MEGIGLKEFSVAWTISWFIFTISCESGMIVGVGSPANLRRPVYSPPRWLGTR